MTARSEDPADAPVEVSVTCASADEAATIGEAAVQARLAACAKHWAVTSTYRWQGEVVHDSEWILLLSTRTGSVDALCALIGERHSYDLPAIVTVPVMATGPGYSDWLRDST